MTLPKRCPELKENKSVNTGEEMVASSETLFYTLQSMNLKIKDLDQMRYLLSSTDEYQKAYEGFKSLKNSYERFAEFFLSKMQQERQSPQKSVNE